MEEVDQSTEAIVEHMVSISGQAVPPSADTIDPPQGTRIPVAKINSLHKEIVKQDSDNFTKALTIGRCLCDIKEPMEHGTWMNWVQNNLEFSHRTATDYMRVYRAKESGELDGVTRLTEAYAAIRGTTGSEEGDENQDEEALGRSCPGSEDDPADSGTDDDRPSTDAVNAVRPNRGSMRVHDSDSIEGAEQTGREPIKNDADPHFRQPTGPRPSATPAQDHEASGGWLCVQGDKDAAATGGGILLRFTDRLPGRRWLNALLSSAGKRDAVVFVTPNLKPRIDRVLADAEESGDDDGSAA